MMAIRQNTTDPGRRELSDANSQLHHEEDKPTISATRRFLLISKGVYDRAQQRGFVGGDPMEDLSQVIRQVDEEYTTDITGLLSLTDPGELAEQFRNLFAGYGLGKRSLDRLLEKNRAALEKLATSNRAEMTGTAERASRRASLLQSAANEAMQNLQSMAQTAKRVERRAHLPGSPTQAVLDLLSQLSNLADSAAHVAGYSAGAGAERAPQARRALEIHGAVVKAYDGMEPAQLADAPTEALKGLSPATASRLEAAFGMTSIRDMADNRLVEQANGIVTLANEESGESVEQNPGTYHESLVELADGPVSRLKGITPRQARALRETLHTRTIRELADNRFFKLARAIVALADMEANQDNR
jgi:hypothetical protein